MVKLNKITLLQIGNYAWTLTAPQVIDYEEKDGVVTMHVVSAIKSEGVVQRPTTDNQPAAGGNNRAA